MVQTIGNLVEQIQAINKILGEALAIPDYVAGLAWVELLTFLVVFVWALKRVQRTVVAAVHALSNAGPFWKAFWSIGTGSVCLGALVHFYQTSQLSGWLVTGMCVPAMLLVGFGVSHLCVLMGDKEKQQPNGAGQKLRAA